MGGDTVCVSLYGEPRGKGRPRFVRATGRVYTDAETVRYEEALRAAGERSMEGRPPLEGALALKVVARFHIPRSWSGKRKALAATGDIRPTTKPDVDNIQKCVGDALQKVVFRDDVQIVLSSITKVYSDRPGLWIEVRPLSRGVAEPRPMHSHENAEAAA